MIDIQIYIDKLESLKEYMAWRIDIPGKLASIEVTSDLMVALKWAWYAHVTTITFDQWYNQKQNP